MDIEIFLCELLMINVTLYANLLLQLHNQSLGLTVSIHLSMISCRILLVIVY